MKSKRGKQKRWRLTPEALVWGFIAVVAAAIIAAATVCSGALPDCFEATARVVNQSGGSLGTACCYRHWDGKAWLVTNAHVVQGEKGIACQFWHRGHQSDVAWPVTVVRAQRDKIMDGAILSIPLAWFDDSPPPAIPVAPLGTELTAGELIHSVGCPKGEWPTGWRGHVLRVADDTLWFVPPPHGGRSGSAIFDSRGEYIVGLLYGRRTDGPIEGMAVPHDALYRFLYGRGKQTGRQWGRFMLPGGEDAACGKCGKASHESEAVCPHCGAVFRPRGDYQLHLRPIKQTQCPGGQCPVPWGDIGSGKSRFRLFNPKGSTPPQNPYPNVPLPEPPPIMPPVPVPDLDEYGNEIPPAPPTPPADDDVAPPADPSSPLIFFQTVDALRRSLEDAERRLEAAEGRVTGLKSEIAIEGRQAVDAAVAQATDAAGRVAGEAAAKAAGEIEGKLGKRIDQVATTVDGVTKTIDGVTQTVDGAVRTVNDVTETVNGVSRSVSNATETAGRLGKRLDRIEAWARGFHQLVTGLSWPVIGAVALALVILWRRIEARREARAGKRAAKPKPAPAPVSAELFQATVPVKSRAKAKPKPKAKPKAKPRPKAKAKPKTTRKATSKRKTKT